MSNVDWVAVLLYFALIAFGWVNIYAATNSGSADSPFDITDRYGMQLIWIGGMAVRHAFGKHAMILISSQI